MTYLKVRYIHYIELRIIGVKIGGWAKRKENEKKESKQRNQVIDLLKDAPTSRTYLSIL